MSDVTCAICGKITASLDHICSECNCLIEYEQQFANFDDIENMIICTEDDMQRFNDNVYAKWREEHAAVIEDWQRIYTQHG